MWSETRLRRPFTLLFASTVVGCQPDLAVDPLDWSTMAGTEALVHLEASSLTAAAGEVVHVGVSLDAPEGVEVAALVGSLAFDPAHLEYLGLTTLDRTVTLDNPDHAADGSVRVLSFRLDGIGERAAVAVFRVREAGYREGLAFQAEAGVTRESELVSISVGEIAISNPLLAASGPALIRVETEQIFELAGIPIPDRTGGPLAVLSGNATLGDCNRDGFVDAVDLVDIARMAVGLDPSPTDPSDLAVCDLDGSGEVNVIDVMDVSRYTVAVATLVSPVGVQYSPLAAAMRSTCAIDSSTGHTYCWGYGPGGQIGDGTDDIIRFEPTPVSGDHDFVDLVGGENHVCGLDRSLVTWCWGGENNKGTLGIGTLGGISTVPLEVVGGHSFIGLSPATDDHVCGIDAGGGAWCWGENQAEGRLGDGVSTTNQATPVAVTDGHTFVDIATGITHTCAVDDQGDAWCWGTDFGTVPALVGGGLTFESVVVGGSHACGLVADGSAYCWGYNNRGQLGDDLGPDTATPVAVSGGLSFARLTAGVGHTCGLTDAGDVYCWGRADRGQIGDGTTGVASCADGDCRPTPTQVLGGHTFTNVDAGLFHTCAMDQAGDVWCWGGNNVGQLGQASDSPLAPLRTAPSEPVPVTFDGEGATGWNHACGLSGGDLYCWGANEVGQFGNGTTEDAAEPVLIGGVPAFTAIGAGDSHTCGIDGTQQAYCWGLNQDGQLGDDNPGVDAWTPVAVTGTHAFTEISGGVRHTCALDTNGQAFCWGGNVAGELGNGTLDPRTQPDSVDGGIAFTDLAVGGSFSCGLDESGFAWCWGHNAYGQIGNGNFDDQTAPASVSLGYQYQEIVAPDGGRHTCALRDNGQAYCWGWNAYGQLGDGSTQNSSVPRLVGNGMTFVTIEVHRWATCGVDTQGDTYCWGSNFYGQLGIGNQEDQTLPALVQGVSAVKLAMMSNTACAIEGDGTVYCWGLNSVGQLGIGLSAQSLEPVQVLPFD